MKYSFFDVHPESAHPEIIKYLLEHNLEHFVDPAEDQYYNLGSERIKKAFGLPEADVHYLPNGTIANATGLSAMLKPFEGVISPTSGHINNYEAGALEATGHKSITVDTPDGKLTPVLIDKALEHHKDYNNTLPRVIYLTQVTELGTVYTKDELVTVIAHAKSKGLYTYLDGARLAMALASPSANISLQEFGALDLDMFYIGGTKNGGLYGEALVIKNPAFKPNFLSYMKRQGAEMAKSRPMSLQFARFFDDDNLWLSLGKYANAMAQKLRQGLINASIDVVPSGEANHIFAILPDDAVAKLQADYILPKWQRIDADHTKIRLVCSWSTTDANIDEFLQSVVAL